MTRRQALSDGTTTTISLARPRLRRAGRVSAVAALSVAGALALGGCQWTSPVQTESQYAPADGWSANIGNLDLRNVLVVADAKGAPGNVVGLAINRGNDPIDVSVQGATGDKLTVPARGTEQLTVSGGRTTTLPSVDAAPGALTTLHITTSAGNTDVQVPVLAGTEYYATLAPTTSAAPTAQPSTGSPTAPTSAPTGTSSAPTGTATPTGGPASTAPAPTSTGG